MYVPLSPSRIVAMHNHYAGNWYPYQDEKGHNPGVIIDPKSPVVVARRSSSWPGTACCPSSSST